MEHLRLPLALGAAGFATVKQDTVDELACNVLCIISFETGSRIEDPDFGIADPAFEQLPVDDADIEAAIAAYEPRAIVSIVEDFDPSDPTAVQMSVQVTLPDEEEQASE